MIHNIIEISTDGKELSSFRGFLRIKEKGEVVKDLPFDSILAILATGRAIAYTNTLLQSLCEYGIPLVICGENFMPSGILLSFVGQQKQTEVQRLQLASSKPLQKQLWAGIVKAKVKNQSRVLDVFGKDNRIRSLPSQVLSGDTGNVEATAARLYFPALFGQDFIRDTNQQGINAFLNYGYAIIRATLARQIVASGLNPSFGIEHHNKLNPFCLVDDMIEPFRPMVDVAVYKMFSGQDDGERLLEPKDKKELAELVHLEIFNGDGMSELYVVLQNYVWSFVSSIKEKKNLMEFNEYLIGRSNGDGI
jgi:CRISPR-associated protein Cas1